MFSQKPLVETRGANYARLASRVLEALNEAVGRRVGEGATKTDIALKIGCHRSQLTRVLNGATPNLTLRTISDILWATDYEPEDFRADPLEVISHNCTTFAQNQRTYVENWVETFSYPTKPISNYEGWTGDPKMNQDFSYAEAVN